MEFKVKVFYIFFFLLFTSCTRTSLNFDESISIQIENCDIFYNENLIQDESSNKEIFIVGHAYGKPGEGNFFPETLLNYFSSNIESSKKNYIGLTGDFVRTPDNESFKLVKSFINKNFDGYFISVGNHEIDNDLDVNGLQNYFNAFGKDLFHEEFNKFLLIAANFSNSDWLPNSNQKSKINNLINNTSKEYIVILSHQLFWLLDADNNISPNSDSLLTESLQKNSLSWIDEFENKNFIIISGDYGAYGDKTHCTTKGNKLFIANGIGDLKSDTLIKIADKKSSFSIVEYKVNEP